MEDILYIMANDEDDYVIEEESEEEVEEDATSRRIHDFEEEADVRGDMEESGYSSEEIEKALENRRRKKKDNSKKSGRGAFKRLKVTEPMFLQIDSFGRATGKWRLKFGQHVGLCSRKLNINMRWSDVSNGLKDTLWEDTRNLFHLPDDPAIKNLFLSTVACRFRDFKAKLVSGWITCVRKRTKQEDGKLPPQIWRHITSDIWEEFKRRKMTPEAEDIRKKASESASQNQHHHHMGQRNYEDNRAIWIDEGFYPSACTNSSSIGSSATQFNRGDDWYCAMHARDKEGNRVIPDKRTQEVAEKYVEYKNKQNVGEFAPQRNRDALYYARGEKADHSGRAIGYGGINVGYSKAFGKKMSGSQYNKRSTQNIESIKSSIREELRREMNETMKLNMIAILNEMGITGFNFSSGASIPTPTTSTNHAPHPFPSDEMRAASFKSSKGKKKLDVHKKPVKQRSLVSEQVLLSLSRDCKWLHSIIASRSRDDPIVVTLDASMFHYEYDDGNAYLTIEDISQFLYGAMINIAIIQVFIIAMQDYLKGLGTLAQLGWMCPDSISATACENNLEDVKVYIHRAITESRNTGIDILVAPYYENYHWVLLVIWISRGMIFIYDSLRTSPMRRLLIMSLFSSVFRIFAVVDR
ncbi:unnamed protein product [Cuscuta europaea]|uniref:Ubiquitin-like protease family profile domain-containing protein n=2 Tax=Cuscuta europaea TaxID=41803 RepID=A0A9P0ZUG4_CUSEU|nr:unnamed protein product [Cuscuta europaea]